jgi:Fe-S-cluster containining protein
MNENFIKEFEQAFFADGYNIAKKILNNNINKENILEITRQGYSYINIFLDDFIGKCKKENAPLDCTKGCSWCCHQPVLALPHEIIYLYDMMQNFLNKNEIDEIKQKALEKNDITGKMEVKKLMHYRHPCPLLENGACRIYEARPMGCRLFLSSSMISCRNDFYDPYNFDEFPLLYQLPLRLGRMLNEGICTYMIENGLIPFEWTFESHLSILFENPDVINEWLNKKNVFQSRLLTKEDEEYFSKFNVGNF